MQAAGRRIHDRPRHRRVRLGLHGVDGGVLHLRLDHPGGHDADQGSESEPDSGAPATDRHQQGRGDQDDGEDDHGDRQVAEATERLLGLVAPVALEQGDGACVRRQLPAERVLQQGTDVVGGGGRVDRRQPDVPPEKLRRIHLELLQHHGDDRQQVQHDIDAGHGGAQVFVLQRGEKLLVSDAVAVRPEALRKLGVEEPVDLLDDEAFAARRGRRVAGTTLGSVIASTSVATSLPMASRACVSSTAGATVVTQASVSKTMLRDHRASALAGTASTETASENESDPGADARLASGGRDAPERRQDARGAGACPVDALDRVRDRPGGAEGGGGGGGRESGAGGPCASGAARRRGSDGGPEALGALGEARLVVEAEGEPQAAVVAVGAEAPARREGGAELVRRAAGSRRRAPVGA